MAIRKAQRKKAKIRLALSDPTGSGKTYSALLIAFGMTQDWSTICVIDTENNSADLYEHLGEYSVNPISAPYSTEKYIAAIKECEADGFEVIIIDSITHEWNGQGGILEMVDNVTASTNAKNAFSSGWKEMTPRHNEFLSAILHSPAHVIATMRSKQEYVMMEENGKKVPKKIGLNPIQREGVEYEFTLHFDLAINNFASPLKDRTELFVNKLSFKPTKETGKIIMDWCEVGVDEKKEIADGIKKLDNCNSVDELKDLKELLPLFVTSSKDFVIAATLKFNNITKPNQPA